VLFIFNLSSLHWISFTFFLFHFKF